MCLGPVTTPELPSCVSSLSWLPLVLVLYKQTVQCHRRELVPFTSAAAATQASGIIRHGGTCSALQEATQIPERRSQACLCPSPLSSFFFFFFFFLPLWVLFGLKVADRDSTQQAGVFARVCASLRPCCVPVVFVSSSGLCLTHQTHHMEAAGGTHWYRRYPGHTEQKQWVLQGLSSTCVFVNGQAGETADVRIHFAEDTQEG